MALTVRREGNALEVTMADDGVGMEAGPVGLFKKIGLNNVHRRIQYEFGPDWGLSIQSEPGRFTRIAVRLPCGADGPEEEKEIHRQHPRPSRPAAPGHGRGLQPAVPLLKPVCRWGGSQLFARHSGQTFVEYVQRLKQD